MSIKDSEIRVINIEDKEYPKLLRETKRAPKRIFVKGKIVPEENCLAIVGTRRCSDYGKEVAWKISGELSERGLTIVSGLAPGIDTYTHLAVVEKRKRTIAVLGTGIDEKSIYPKSNIGLAKKIIETGGALISEYPPGTRGARFTFPERNRIISGLSLGTLVVEAKKKSGALITADWAKKQKRKLFAIPGSIFSLNSKGPHRLIKEGAKLIESYEDILEELAITSQLNFSRKISAETNEEELILEALKQGALDLEKIIQKTKLAPEKLMSSLTLMELSGKVKNLAGNIYTINS